MVRHGVRPARVGVESGRLGSGAPAAV